MLARPGADYIQDIVGWLPDDAQGAGAASQRETVPVWFQLYTPLNFEELTEAQKRDGIVFELWAKPVVAGVMH